MSVFFPKKTGTPPRVNKKKERDELIETLEDKIIELEDKLKRQGNRTWPELDIPTPAPTNQIWRVGVTGRVDE